MLNKPETYSTFRTKEVQRANSKTLVALAYCLLMVYLITAGSAVCSKDSLNAEKLIG